ncbi:MAG TPA: type II toxin-antitoxin system HicA family toxin [Pyrinomonadaceae bacterium]|nr:type II toxin-antitoxin system HicA family toxin [Pyrinomonadaceae bacterium]
MRYREIEKKLRKLGCVEVRRRGGGSHRKWHNPAQSPIVVVAVPDWGSKDLKTGTLRSIVKDLGFEWDEFISG